jgi:hypothetical protein
VLCVGVLGGPRSWVERPGVRIFGSWNHYSWTNNTEDQLESQALAASSPHALAEESSRVSVGWFSQPYRP